MANYKWDLKSNYMLAFTVCKYGIGPEQWNFIANDLADYINITPQSCQAQFDRLCQQYGRDWQKQSVEPLHSYIFSMIKRLYYGDLCERMTESRDLLMVMYDFIRLFKTGRITSNDINDILQDIKNTASTGNDNEREQKIKMLGRLKLHMTTQNSEISDVQFSSFPVELLPPPPFFQQPIITNYMPPEQTVLITNENDRQVPSMDSHQISNPTGISSFPIIIQSNNLLMENERQSSKANQSNEVDIDEIELSSDDDDDDGDNDRTAIAQMSNTDIPTSNSNLINDQDESTFVSDEPMDINESSNILPIPTEISNSDDRDLYDNVSSTSISNQSTYDTRLSAEERATSSINSQPAPLNLQLNASISGSNDYMTSDNGQIQSIENQYHHLDETESTPQRILVDDDEVARMDAEQIPEPIPADIIDVIVPNDNAVFVVDELVASKMSTRNLNEQSMTSNTTLREMEVSSEIHASDESTTPRNLSRQSRLTTSSTSNNFRKSINSILNNLKSAKYGYNFSRPLKSFKLPDEYYFRIKKPLDIPEIRERMNNGDYDDNILLFERDILLMFTNALTMYHRDIDIHAHSQYMMNYAMELLIPIKEFVIPWKNETDGDLSSVFHHENNILNSSSIDTDLSTKNLRRQATPNHPMNKRQRKTTH